MKEFPFLVYTIDCSAKQIILSWRITGKITVEKAMLSDTGKSQFFTKERTSMLPHSGFQAIRTT